ncbi:MAG: glycerophosphodiester phosphodiesterase family protein [Rhizobium sp.]
MTFASWHNPPAHSLLAIAHRGGAALGPENTAAAFEAAAAAGADAVETDVRVSADGTLVCLHDADLQRLCGDPRAVADLDLAMLRSLLPGLLTLDAAIAASAPLGILLDIKLMDYALLPKIIRAVETGGGFQRAILGLRHEKLIAEARRISSEIAILAFLPDAHSAPRAARLGANWFRLWQADADEARIAAARQAGLQVAVMVGQPRDIPLPEYPQFPVGQVDADGLAQLYLLAPDAIMLDDPRLLRRSLLSMD